MPIVPLPSPIPFFLRPFLWLAKRITGKANVPGMLLAWFPKGAMGAGVFELSAASAPKDLEARVLAVARIAYGGEGPEVSAPEQSGAGEGDAG